MNRASARHARYGITFVRKGKCRRGIVREAYGTGKATLAFGRFLLWRVGSQCRQWCSWVVRGRVFVR